MAKILYVLNSGQPGGMELHTLDLASGMVNKGHSVFVWCAEGPVAKSFSAVTSKVTVSKINLDIDPLYILKLAFFIGRNRIDVVHAHELKAVANAAIASRLAGVKNFISHTHTPISEWQSSKFKKKLALFVYKNIVNLLSGFEICLTEHIKKTKVSEGIKLEKLVVIPNGLNEKFLHCTDEEKRKLKGQYRDKLGIPYTAFVVGNMSRITVEKGYDLLVDAFSQIRDENTFLLVAGGGELEEFLRKAVEKKNLTRKVIWTGVFDDADKLGLMAVFDLLVFPSRAEGFGYTPIEFIAFGVPVLLSDLPVLKEVCGENVAYFKSGDSRDLLTNLNLITKNYKEYKEYIKHLAKDIGEKYSMESFISSYENLYFGKIG